MTLEEILRWLRRFKYDPEFRNAAGARTVPMKCFCDFAGVPRQDVYEIMSGEARMTDSYQQRLSYAIEQVQNGMRFECRNPGKRYVIVGGTFTRMPARNVTAQDRA